jgi:hypothetical protein
LALIKLIFCPKTASNCCLVFLLSSKEVFGHQMSQRRERCQMLKGDELAKDEERLKTPNAPNSPNSPDSGRPFCLPQALDLTSG